MVQSKILVIGAGGVGSIYGWRLQIGGAHVSMVCRSNFRTIKDVGFHISSKKYGDGSFLPDMVYSSAKDAFEDDQKYDYILVCTKSLPNIMNPADVLKGCKFAEGTVIVLVQNGIGIETYFHDAFPQNRILSAVAYIDTKQSKDGLIEHGERNDLSFGLYMPNKLEFYTDQNRKMCNDLVDCFIAGGAGAKVSENIQRERWFKVIWNSSFNPISVLAGGSNSTELLNMDGMENMIKDTMLETISIGEAVVKMPLSNFSNEEIFGMLIYPLRGRVPPVYPSMLVDFENKRPMEHEVILKNVINYADELGVKTPNLKVIYQLILAVESKYLK
ncbi:hypothetical protein AYI68_g6356 [Smittium mucronatum]|uniref:2-dehydropantoate 2-reductase n=1 Tax=Smittium mucronatum TaxID=133383 RepID=A0A1R0GRP8_9FUNG|nr:hypothetical protein AYI68_g6356 [Smittium mucronatum]